MSFDHCAGRRSGSASAFRPDSTIVSAISRTRSNGVSSYGPSHVSVSRMYSTCVSEWRVPLMKVTPETIGQSPCARTTSSAPMPLSTVMTVASGKRPSSACAAGLEPRCLRRDDRDVERRELRRIVGCRHARMTVALAAHAKPITVQAPPHALVAASGPRRRKPGPDDPRRGSRSPLPRRCRPVPRCRASIPPSDMSVN